MNELRYTFLTDGSSDKALIPLLDWLLREHHVRCPIQPQWADLRRVARPPKTLPERISLSLKLYPCDLLFVHRDAEGAPLTERKDEILVALERARAETGWPRELTVCVIPVRMQEAWLLFDEPAIRATAGKRSGGAPLEVPLLKELERLPDPKTRLHDLLRQASGLSGRRLKSFPVYERVQHLLDFVRDFSPLRELSAFSALEQDIRAIITQHGWAQPEVLRDKPLL